MQGAGCAGSGIPGMQGCGVLDVQDVGCRTVAFPLCQSQDSPWFCSGVPTQRGSLPSAPAAAVAGAGAGTAPGEVQPGWIREFFPIFQHSARQGRCEHRHCCGCALEGGAALRARRSSRAGTRGAGIAPCLRLEVTVLSLQQGCDPWDTNEPCVLPKPAVPDCRENFYK